MILGLTLLACRIAERAQNSPADPAAVETAAGGETNPPETGPSSTEESASLTSTPSQGQAPATDTAAPTVFEKPPQSPAAEIHPPERRQELTRLSGLIGFQVIDRNGALLGSVSDYIINTCETYIIYILLDPASTLGFSPGSRLVIPFEAVTINSGALDAGTGSVVLYLTPEQLRGSPTFPASAELIPTGWEVEVRAFFSKMIRISNLTTECRVAAPGTDSAGGTVVVQKIAYATQLLGAELRDGLQNTLGTLEEAILEPESGKLSFFVVNLLDGQGLVLVPLRVVNIPKEALEPGNEIALVLLTENNTLLNAPKIAAFEEAARVEAQNTARGYWNR